MASWTPPGGRRIPSIGPSITEAEIALVSEAVATGWYGRMSAHVDAFVSEFSARVGKPHCLPVSHGTAAIHLALLGLGVGPGDEVVVPDITWVACAAPVLYVGATPVFADIEADSWCLSPAAFESAITERTKAVIAVDLFGNMADMHAIRAVAERHSIAVIEDAAEAIGATLDGLPAGSFGDIGIFSFNATKLVIAGQGGMTVTADESLHERMRLLSHHGIDKSPGARYYWSTELGYNYNWTNLQAALALAQLRRLEELVEQRRTVHRWYRERLDGIGGLTLNSEAPTVRNTYWITVGILDAELNMDKETLQEAFKSYGIDARPYFYPISEMPPYRAFRSSENMADVNPVAYDLAPRGICFPSGADLTEAEVDYVCRALLDILRTKTGKVD